MPISNYALDEFVSQDLSALNAPAAKSVVGEFPNIGTWLQSLVMRSMFTNPLNPNFAALAFAMVRRAQAGIEDYDEACACLRGFTQKKGRSVSAYFRALRKFESAIAMAVQAFDFARAALKEDYFTPGDGSPKQRLNGVYNHSRHTNLSSLPVGHLHTIWLRNDEICTDVATLRFNEFEDLLRELGRIADKISKGGV